MVGIIIALLVAIIVASLVFIDGILLGLVDTVFYLERTIFGGSGSVDIHGVETLIFNFGISFLILKFLKKGFDIYVGWYDGDKDADPVYLVINFARAIIAMVSFAFFYDLLYKVTKELIDNMFDALNTFNANTLIDVLKNLADTAGIGYAIAGVILVIMILVLYIQFLARGAELFIMRLFFPVSCIGLIDSDKGVFAPYVKNFFMCASTVVVQLICLKISIYSAIDAHILIAIAFCMLAMKTPKLMDKFLVSSGSVIGSGLNNIYHAQRLIQTLTKKAG